MTLTLGSLFSGIGGFELAASRVGIETRWHAEIDAHACRVLRHHWPGVPNYGDVTTLDPARLAPVDIITFGSPCQDLSVVGQRRGFAGERSGLFFDAIRIIDAVRPVVAIWENVPGSLSSHRGRDFGSALDALANIGALDIAWAVLDAQWFGIPQRRRRVFVVADFRGESAAQILSLTEGLSGHSPPRRTAGQGITARTVGSLTASGRGVSRTGESRGQNPVVPFDMTQVTSGVNRQRLAAGDPARTLHAAGGAHVINAGAMQVRRLTPTECLRLQGFEDSWLDLDPPLSDSAKYRLIGNSVAVPVVEWLLGRIAAMERERTP